MYAIFSRKRLTIDILEVAREPSRRSLLLWQFPRENSEPWDASDAVKVAERLARLRHRSLVGVRSRLRLPFILAE
jgi:hypothetical protein